MEKLIGDAVMAVLGTPVATEDDAERAARAALDLVAAVNFRRAAELSADPRVEASLLDRSGRAALRANPPAAGRELLERAHSMLSAAEPESAALVSA